MIEQYTSPVFANAGQEPWLTNRGIMVSGGVAIPSLYFDFLTGTLPDTITFTRASSATYFDSTGALQTASTNTARFDYNPSTLAARGLLIEEQRTNSMLYSEQFDNAAWVKTRSTITADAINAPSGAQTADKLVEDTSTGSHLVSQVASITTTSRTLSVFLKAGERTLTSLEHVGNTGNAGLRITINLATGTITNRQVIGTGGLNSYSDSITSVGNGWYKVTITINPTTTTGNTATLVFSLLDGAGASSYTGDGTSGAYIWGAQIEAGAFATSYITTTTAAATRSADVAIVSTLTPWYNASEGALFAKYILSNIVLNNSAVSVSDGTNNNRMIIRASSTSAQTVFIGVVATVTQWNGTVVNSALADTITKSAFAYATNNIAWVRNGGTVFTDTSATIPTVTQLNLGSDGPVTFPLNGWLSVVSYYPRRLSNVELQAITS